MKIRREDQPSIIIGKRVTLGAIIGGLVSVGSEMWNLTNPDTPLSAALAVGLTTALTGILQVLIANTYGITTQDSS